MANITGTIFNDYLLGSSEKDTIRGLSGNDMLFAEFGGDSLYGGRGRDQLYGNEDNNRIFGGAGSDDLFGDDGDDFLDPGGNSDFDLIAPGAGHDTVRFSAPASPAAFYGLSHSDLPGRTLQIHIDGMTGQGSVDKGADGITTIVNVANALNSGGLLVYASRFNDTIFVNPGDNGLIQITDTGGSDTIRVGASTGQVVLSYAGNSQGITADLGAKTISDGNGGTDTLSGPGHVTELFGSGHADSITGSSHDERFKASAGDDFVDGAGGTDWMDYGASAYNKYVVVDLLAEKASGFAGSLLFTHTLKNIENIRGSRVGEDELFGNGKANIIRGEDGDDYLDGRRGKDKLYGEGDDDTLKGGGAADLLDGGEDDDILTGGAGRDTFVYTDGADRITDFKGGARGDKLRLDDDLWGGLSLTRAKVLEFASVVGGDTVFDFAGGDTLTLEDYTDIAGLKALIEIF